MTIHELYHSFTDKRNTFNEVEALIVKKTMTDWITLNVGGTKFTTTRSTLTSDPDSMLAKMFEHEGAMEPAAKDNDGAYLIDGDPKYFDPILQFLRRGKVIIDPEVNHEGILEEARYFGIQSMVDKIEEDFQEKKKTTRKVVVGSKVRLKTTYYGHLVKGEVTEINKKDNTITIKSSKEYGYKDAFKLSSDDILAVELLDRNIDDVLSENISQLPVGIHPRESECCIL